MGAGPGTTGPAFSKAPSTAGRRARRGPGRVYTCATQTIGGFPFGIEVRCADAGAEFKSNRPPLALKAKDMLVSAHVWQPTVLTTEFVGPLTIAEPGQPVTIQANWRHAKTKVHGLPTSPESVSIAVEQPVVDRAAGGNLFKADRLDLNGRLVSGTVQANPVIEMVLKLAAASAPSWHPAAANPVDADITAVLRGLKDFRRSPGRRAFANCRPPTAASTSPARVCSSATPLRSRTARSDCRPPAGSTASFA